ncbi:MAG TPA: ZPR1 zinc finger domain-containing protein [Euryarchaeota archaeon]|nr:ZPR1 zinc finger domain-containing protein [Euryarchaeota archaeon]
MSVRVVRSSMGRIIIPKLGVEISPGGDSQGFISNIEGVLDRVSMAVRTATHWSDDGEKKMKAEILLGRIDDIKDGKEKVTVITEDTSGNSAIISDKAIKEKI